VRVPESILFGATHDRQCDVWTSAAALLQGALLSVDERNSPQLPGMVAVWVQERDHYVQGTKAVAVISGIRSLSAGSGMHGRISPAPHPDPVRTQFVAALSLFLVALILDLLLAGGLCYVRRWRARWPGSGIYLSPGMIEVARLQRGARTDITYEVYPTSGSSTNPRFDVVPACICIEHVTGPLRWWEPWTLSAWLRSFLLHDQSQSEFLLLAIVCRPEYLFTRFPAAHTIRTV